MSALCIIGIAAGIILVYAGIWAMCQVAAADDTRNGRQEWQQK